MRTWLDVESMSRLCPSASYFHLHLLLSSPECPAKPPSPLENPVFLHRSPVAHRASKTSRNPHPLQRSPPNPEPRRPIKRSQRARKIRIRNRNQLGAGSARSLRHPRPLRPTALHRNRKMVNRPLKRLNLFPRPPMNPHRRKSLLTPRKQVENRRLKRMPNPLPEPAPNLPRRPMAKHPSHLQEPALKNPRPRLRVKHPPLLRPKSQRLLLRNLKQKHKSMLNPNRLKRQFD